jgi:hypothetical protein
LSQDNTLQNRREFFRLKFTNPVQFKSYTPGNTARSAETRQAVTQNVSQSGILFQTGQTPPQLSSIVWMNVDLRTLKICQEIEERALIFNEGVLGRVVRVEEDAKQADTYDIGICFLTQDQKSNREVQQILTQIQTK